MQILRELSTTVRYDLLDFQSLSGELQAFLLPLQSRTLGPCIALVRTILCHVLWTAFAVPKTTLRSVVQ